MKADSLSLVAGKTLRYTFVALRELGVEIDDGGVRLQHVFR
jgi:hypothetical protein